MIKSHTELHPPTLSQAMDRVLSNLMAHFGTDLFTEIHRFRGAILDEPITHQAKKVRFLLMLAMCDMKAYARLKTLNMYDLIDEMVTDYEINREAATATIRAIAKLHNLELPAEPVAPPAVKPSEPKPKVDPAISQDLLHKLFQDPRPTSATAQAQSSTITSASSAQPQKKDVASLYQAHASETIKPTQHPAAHSPPPDIPTKQVLQAPELPPVAPVKPKPTPPKPKRPAHKIGDIIYFGQHKWRILRLNPDNTALILADSIVNKMGYHNRKVGITWEGSDMRKYLNGNFLSKFTPSEQQQIRAIQVENRFNEKYFTQGGLQTIDKIFLLSLGEVKAYIPKEADRMARHGGAPIWWWLRSPGMYPDHTAYVYASGSLSLDGEASVYTYENNGMHFVGYRVGGVRPAMVISLETVTKT